MDIKKNWPVILGFALPVLMVLLVAASIYAPAMFKQPKYNFVYTNEDHMYCPYGHSTYQVKNNKIEKVDRGNNKIPPLQPLPDIRYPDTRYERIDPRCESEQQLYLHNVKTNQSSTIILEQAQKLNLDQSVKSPDEFEVSRGGGGGIFSGGRSYDKVFIKGHNTSRQLNLKFSGNSYGFRFIAWVIN